MTHRPAKPPGIFGSWWAFACSVVAVAIVALLFLVLTFHAAVTLGPGVVASAFVFGGGGIWLGYHIGVNQ